MNKFEQKLLEYKSIFQTGQMNAMVKRSLYFRHFSQVLIRLHTVSQYFLKYNCITFISPIRVIILTNIAFFPMY